MIHNRLNTDNKVDENEENDEDENLWLEILNQVQESSTTKLPSCKSLLILGDEESGKTSLIAKLKGSENTRKGAGLEYHYLYIKDEYREDSTRLGAFVLDGDTWHRNLLKFVLNEDSFQHTTVLLTVSMSTPWKILDSLQTWIQILEEHIERLRLPKDVLEQHRSKVLKRYQDYCEPGSEIDGVTSPNRPAQTHVSIGTVNRDIKRNLGLEIIVVITKSDYISTLEKECDMNDQHFDFIQLTLRNFCLIYGASLIYTSSKEDKNCDLLGKFLVHKIFAFPFRSPALVVEKDAVFIPAGWDNENKINILVDNLTTVNSNSDFHEVIAKPISRKTPMQREAEVSAEEDQLFLCKLQLLLNQQVPVTGGRSVNTQDTPIRAPPSVQKTAERRISGSPGVQASPKKIEGKAGTVGSEGVLQNFFNSLLNRRTGTPISGPLPSVRNPNDKAASRNDAAAELDRMQRSKKSSGLDQSLEPSYSEDGGDNSGT